MRLRQTKGYQHIQRYSGRKGQEVNQLILAIEDANTSPNSVRHLMNSEGRLLNVAERDALIQQLSQKYPTAIQEYNASIKPLFDQQLREMADLGVIAREEAERTIASGTYFPKAPTVAEDLAVMRMEGKSIGGLGKQTVLQRAGTASRAIDTSNDALMSRLIHNQRQINSARLGTTVGGAIDQRADARTRFSYRRDAPRTGSA